MKNFGKNMVGHLVCVVVLATMTWYQEEYEETMADFETMQTRSFDRFVVQENGKQIVGT